MQLYFFGIVTCLIQFLYSAETGQSFFKGFTWLTWLVIAVNALYGQVVAFTLKYADNIVKVYANSMSSLATALISYALFSAPLTMGLLNGSVIAGISILMYYGDHKKLLDEDTLYFSQLKNKPAVADDI